MIDWRDIVTRAVKTFVQGFLAVVSVEIMLVKDWEGLGTLLFAGVIGGIAGLISFLQNWVKATK